MGTAHFSLMLIGFISLHQRKNIGLKVTFSHAQISLFFWHFAHFSRVFLKLCFELNRRLLWIIMMHCLINFSRSAWLAYLHRDLCSFLTVLCLLSPEGIFWIMLEIKKIIVHFPWNHCHSTLIRRGILSHAPFLFWY